jgi:phosphatidylserine/phosphatidylglycerophosphate/cardiolipin synthase-like enzyme
MGMNTDNECLKLSGVTRTPGTGNLKVLGAGRLGSIAKDEEKADAADVAMEYLLRNAKSEIRIAQQDLGYLTDFWDEGMDAIAAALLKGRFVSIVLTNEDARAGPAPGSPYWNGTLLRATADEIRKRAHSQAPKMPMKDLNQRLCDRLFLAPLRFGPSSTWPNGWTFANHSKFFMIDSKVFYVGSENLYPANHQEYGVFISDRAAVKKMKDEYWDKLQEYSQRARISGNLPKTKCYFQQYPG